MESELDEVTLPTLPCCEPSLPLAPPFSQPSSRKRPFLRSREPSSYEDQLAEAITTSSDPAFFSNDETPDAENYSSGMKRRKKKTYEGTWWGDKARRSRTSSTQSAVVVEKKRQFRRNFDSGIFMADDSSGTDLSSGGLLEQELLDTQEREKEKKARQDAEDKNNLSLQAKTRAPCPLKFESEAMLKRMPQGRPIKPKDHLIRKVVQHCLANNDENVDWTGMALDYLPPVVTDLRSMIKRILSVSTDNKLAPFEAQLRIYLGNNEFKQVPPPLLEITNIELLSMRQNSLAELPPGMRNLVNLRELNLSSNNLSFLPFEVLMLMRQKKLEVINALPNPWMPPPNAQDCLAGAPLVSIMTTKNMECRRVAVSKPTEFPPSGISWSSADQSQPMSKVPHLSEMVLRALLRHNASKIDLGTYLSDEHPQSAKTLLGTLYAAQLSGGRVCTFCNRDMVLPRFQWYEWWYTVNYVERFIRVRTDISLYEARDFARAQSTKEYYRHQMPDGPVDISQTVQEKLIPYQRMACGCVDVRIGLVKEVNSLARIGAPIPHESTASRHEVEHVPVYADPDGSDPWAPFASDYIPVRL